jgi:protein CpxP
MSTPRNKSLIFIIIFLLLTNLAVLGYFLFNKKGPKPKAESHAPGIEMELRKDVGFNDDQIAQYKVMRDEQWKKFRPMFDDVRKAKDSLFRLLGNENANDSVVASVAAVIGERQKAMDLQAFSHFKKIRMLCSADQLAKYDSLIPRLIRKMGGGKRGDDHKDDHKKENK